MQRGFVIILILALIVGIFAISNSGVVAVDFIFTEVLLSQAIVIFICVLLGALIASIFGWIRQMSLKKEIKQLKNKNITLETKVNDLSTKLTTSENDLKLLKLKDESNIVEEERSEKFIPLDR